MRRVSQEVKPRGGENAFEASFSRALRTLEARGLIEFPREVPVYTDEVDATERLDDGLYLLSPKPYRLARLIEWRLKEREPSIELRPGYSNSNIGIRCWLSGNWKTEGR
jgi:hypothetical protein